MSYLTQSKLAGDGDLARRITACAALEKIPEPGFWVSARMWDFSAQPGWVETYKSAISTPGTKPGENEAAVTDAMILAAVRKLYAPPTPTEPDLNESPA